MPPSVPGRWPTLAARRALAVASPFGSGGASPRPIGPWSGTLRRRAPRRVVDAVYEGRHLRPLDANALSWYDPVTAHILTRPGRPSSGSRHWAPVVAPWDVHPRPSDLAAWCRQAAALHPDLPVWVGENGMATLTRNGRFYPRRDGWDRPTFLRRHLAALVEAADSGVPVAAYFHWSLVDSYEWGSFTPRFGIFGLDRDHGHGRPRWLRPTRRAWTRGGLAADGGRHPCRIPLGPRGLISRMPRTRAAAGHGGPISQVAAAMSSWRGR